MQYRGRKEIPLPRRQSGVVRSCYNAYSVSFALFREECQSKSRKLMSESHKSCEQIHLKLSLEGKIRPDRHCTPVEACLRTFRIRAWHACLTTTVLLESRSGGWSKSCSTRFAGWIAGSLGHHLSGVVNWSCQRA
jgi:hypothetical protein